MYKNKTLISIGNVLFKYRNLAFPVLIIGLFLIAPPPHEIFGNERNETIKDVLALLISSSGLFIRAVVIGFAYIKRGGKNKKVYADNLVIEGIFRICRNPLYVGNMLIYSGIFLMHGDFIVMLTGITLFYFIYVCIIAAEEEYLYNKFGEEYREYCKNTNRWLIDLTKYRQATKGMRFDFKKVLFKDYSTIINTIIVLCLVEEYEYLALPHQTNISYLWFLLIMIVFSLSLAISVSYMKRNKLIVIK